MAHKLDISKTIVFEERPTAYMEDIISQIVDDLGGETALPIADQIELAVSFPSIQGWINLAQLKRLRMP